VVGRVFGGPVRCGVAWRSFRGVEGVSVGGWPAGVSSPVARSGVRGGDFGWLWGLALAGVAGSWWRGRREFPRLLLAGWVVVDSLLLGWVDD